MPSVKRIFVLAFALLLPVGASAQQNPKPMTNADVISMVKNLLPESVIVAAIKTSQTNFDTSPAGLIALKKAGVSTKIMESMLAGVGNRANGGSPASPGATSPATTSPAAPGVTPVDPTGLSPGNPPSSTTPLTTQQTMGASATAQPMAFFLQGGTKFNVPAEATQIAQTKSKANSLSALAEDQAVNEALRLGSEAIQQAISNTGSVMGSSAVTSGTTIFSAILSRKQSQKPNKVTYVWALPGASSGSFTPNNLPSFEVDYAGIPGVNSDAFEPQIVKLSVSQSTFRLVGATEAATSVQQSAQQEWPMYSSFIEDRIPSTVQKLASGQARVTPNAALAPGQYAVALRPTDKSHKFSGEQVGKNQGEGLLFNYAWSFAVK